VQGGPGDPGDRAPQRFAWPLFFFAAGFCPRLPPPWIGRAPAAKLSRYGAANRGWCGRAKCHPNMLDNSWVGLGKWLMVGCLPWGKEFKATFSI